MIDRPWDNEPDELDFEHAGLKCALRRSENAGIWCGYVRITEGHPLWTEDFDAGIEALDSFVHGGITWTRDQLPSSKVCDGKWFGFDCGHCDDYMPKLAIAEGTTYRTIDYAKTECEKLADQLAVLRDGPGILTRIVGWLKRRKTAR